MSGSTPRGRGARSGGRTTAAWLVAGALVWAGATLSGAVVAAGAAGAVTTSTLTITEPGTSTSLEGGGSATPWGVVLPANASCPGDSATGGYRVFSYLVPKSVSPSQVSFKGELPSEYYGFVAYGAYFGAINTAQGTGQIVNVPTQFSWARLNQEELFPHGSPATWEGGIACVNTHGQVTDVWNTQLVFTQSSTDAGGFTWRVDQPNVVPGSSHTGLLVGIGLLVVAAAAGATATYLARRRGPSDPDRPTDSDGTTDGRREPDGPDASADRPTAEAGARR